MNSLIAIEQVSQHYRYWSRYWYRTCNFQGNRRYRKTAGSRRKDHKEALLLDVHWQRVLQFSVW